MSGPGLSMRPGPYAPCHLPAQLQSCLPTLRWQEAGPAPGELLQLLDVLQPARVALPPAVRYANAAELEEATLLPNPALHQAALHERPWDRDLAFEDAREPNSGTLHSTSDCHPCGEAAPGPDWAHIDAAAEKEDPYHLRDPARAWEGPAPLPAAGNQPGGGATPGGAAPPAGPPAAARTPTTMATGAPVLVLVGMVQTTAMISMAMA